MHRRYVHANHLAAALPRQLPCRPADITCEINHPIRRGDTDALPHPPGIFRTAEVVLLAKHHGASAGAQLPPGEHALQDGLDPLSVPSVFIRGFVSLSWNRRSTPMNADRHGHGIPRPRRFNSSAPKNTHACSLPPGAQDGMKQARQGVKSRVPAGLGAKARPAASLWFCRPSAVWIVCQRDPLVNINCG
jgi:hypothetical protein